MQASSRRLARSANLTVLGQTIYTEKNHAWRTGGPPGKQALQISIADIVRQDHTRAVSDTRNGEDAAALERYRRILCADPGDRLASANLVWLATRISLMSDLAARYGLRAVRQFPDDIRLKYLTGRTLFWRGRLAKAIPLLGDCVESGPDPKRAFALLGEALNFRREVADSPRLGGAVPAPAGPRLLAFTRDMISLDHLLPVVWRWSETGTRDAVIVITGALSASDARVSAAREMRGVHVRGFCELSDGLDIDAVTRNLLAGATAGIVVFDKSNDVTARIVGGAARRQGAGFAALPHGEEAFVNRLTQIHETARPPAPKPDDDLFDLSVHASDLTLIKYGLPTGPRVAVLGSARYCRRWLRECGRWLAPAGGGERGKGLRLVLFLPKPEKIVDWLELERVMTILAGRPGVTLMVKPHPRKGGRHRLERRNGEWVLERQRTEEHDLHAGISAPGSDAGWTVAPPDLESAALVAAADAVLALGTSVTWEAVARNKPVLELSWCHGSRSTLAAFLPCTDLRCRDDLLDALDRIARDGPQAFYVRSERDAFLKWFIEPDPEAGEAAVLDAYVDALDRVATTAAPPVDMA